MSTTSLQKKHNVVCAACNNVLYSDVAISKDGDMDAYQTSIFTQRDLNPESNALFIENVQGSLRLSTILVCKTGNFFISDLEINGGLRKVFGGHLLKLSMATKSEGVYYEPFKSGQGCCGNSGVFCYCVECFNAVGIEYSDCSEDYTVDFLSEKVRLDDAVHQ